MCLLAFLGPFADQNNRFLLPFRIVQLVKSLHFHMPKPKYILGHFQICYDSLRLTEGKLNYYLLFAEPGCCEEQ